MPRDSLTKKFMAEQALTKRRMNARLKGRWRLLIYVTRRESEYCGMKSDRRSSGAWAAANARPNDRTTASSWT